MKVDGEARVGWNNLLVDVIYGLVEFQLARWDELIYQVNEEPGTVVEVGLHEHAVLLSMDLLDTKNARLDLSTPWIAEQGICLVVMGAGQWSVSGARALARQMGGPQLQIGFEQKLQAKAVALPEHVVRSSVDFAVEFEIGADGEMRVAGREISTDAQMVNLLRQDGGAGAGKYLVLVDQEAGVVDLRNLLLWLDNGVDRINKQADRIANNRAYCQVGNEKIYEVVYEDCSASISMEFAPRVGRRLVLNGAEFEWNALYTDQATLISEYVTSSRGRRTVGETQRWMRKAFGPDAVVFCDQILEVRADQVPAR